MRKMRAGDGNSVFHVPPFDHVFSATPRARRETFARAAGLTGATQPKIKDREYMTVSRYFLSSKLAAGRIRNHGVRLALLQFGFRRSSQRVASAPYGARNENPVTGSVLLSRLKPKSVS
jgi:hypothetical protein